MNIKKSGIIVSAFLITILSSCNAVTPPDTAYTEGIIQQTMYETETADSTETTTVGIEEPSFQEIEYSETAPFTDMDITSRQIDDIILFGEKYGNYISRRAAPYFSYSADCRWYINYEDGFINEEGDRMFHACVGLRTKTGDDTQNDSTVPISYASGKKYLCEKLHLTEKCFEQLCKNAPSSYCEKDGKLYISEGYGGGAGWDGSVIVDYTTDGDSITYNCKRIAWEGNEDKPFTITLKYTDGVWLLDDCSYIEGFCIYFCETEILEDYEDYYDF